MIYNYFNYENLTVTNTETMDKREFKTYKEAFAFLFKLSNTTFVYGLDELAKPISNLLFEMGYNYKRCSSPDEPLNTKEFHAVGFFSSDATYQIRARRNTKIQLKIRDASKLFGGASIEQICNSVYETEDMDLGMALALNDLILKGYTKMTLSSNSLKDLKERSFGKKYCDLKFKELFPTLDEEQNKVSQDALRGGLCHINKDIIGETVYGGIVLDVNSMYPSIMETELLPFGNPVEFEGKFNPGEMGKKTWIKNLFIQKIYIKRLMLKPNGIPCIKKKDIIYSNTGCYGNDYNIYLTLTSVDMKLLFENYMCIGVEYLGGYAFPETRGIFNEFINYWRNEKIEGQKGNDNFRTFIAKMFLNNSFGKFGLKTGNAQARFFMSRHGEISRTLDAQNITDANSSVYAPMSAFITAYGRQRLVKMIKQNKDTFLYSDTDSVHLNIDSLDEANLEGIKINSTEFGAWKVENVFTKATYLGKKQYILELEDGSLKVTCAGMPLEVSSKINNFNEFNFGKIFNYSYDKIDNNFKKYEVLISYELKNEEIL